MPQDKIVAVGLLTERDLNVLGSGFQRLFRVDRDDMFHDLISALDELETTASVDQPAAMCRFEELARREEEARLRERAESPGPGAAPPDADPTR